MKALQQEDWEEAARQLFEDEYSLVATGARARDSWMLDAIAIMRREVNAVLAREVGDPRAWAGVDDACERPGKSAGDGLSAGIIWIFARRKGGA